MRPDSWSTSYLLRLPFGISTSTSNSSTLPPGPAGADDRHSLAQNDPRAHLGGDTEDGREEGAGSWRDETAADDAGSCPGSPVSSCSRSPAVPPRQMRPGASATG